MRAIELLVFGGSLGGSLFVSEIDEGNTVVNSTMTRPASGTWLQHPLPPEPLQEPPQEEQPPL